MEVYLDRLEMLLQDLCRLTATPSVDPPVRTFLLSLFLSRKYFSLFVGLFSQQKFCAPKKHSLPADVVEGLWRGYDVEGWGHGAALLEVGDPQLGPRELPLGVRLLLRGQSLARDQSDHPGNQA